MDNTNICSQCGSQRSPCLNPSNSPPSSTDEITYLNKERARIAEQIRLLKVQSAPFGRRLNELHPSIRVLPPEILSEIFQHACHNIYKDEVSDVQPLFNILHVCFYWSQTARSIPRLWNTLRLMIHSQSNREYKANLLQLWLTNSRGALNLDLCDYGSYHYSTETVDVDPFLVIFTTANSQKIGKLKIFNLLLPLVSTITRKCVNIEELTISRPECGVINLENQLRLHTLNLTAWLPGTHLLLPSTPNITTLKLKDFENISLCLGVLAQCKNTLINLYLSLDSDFVYQGKSVTLDCLQTLHLQMFDTLPISISHLKFPALQNLILDIRVDDHHTPPSLESIPRLFQSLPHTSVTLRISICNVSFEHRNWLHFLDCLLKNSEQTRALHILSIDSDPLQEIFKLLREVQVLPHLCQLRIPLRTFDDNLFWNETDVWLDFLLEMLENRKPGLIEPFCLEMYGKYGCKSGQNIKELRDLVAKLADGGCKISFSISDNISYQDILY